MFVLQQSQSERFQNVDIIGAASAIGAPEGGPAEAPDLLWAIGLGDALNSDAHRVSWNTVRLTAGKDRISLLADFCSSLAGKLSASVAHGHFPIVLGGDHSCAIGTWRGVAQASQVSGPVGLIWIDAHLDSHTPETSRSGELHGMPLACLLGFGAAQLTQDRATLQPQHVAVIGVRSYEPDELVLLKRLGVRIFAMEEISQRGLEAVLREALAIVQTGTAGFGVTLDLDAIDPQDAPGVSTPEPAGIRAPELICALQPLFRHSKLLALEIAEYNPYRDEQGKTAGLIQNLLAALLPSGTAARPSMIELEQRYGAHNYNPLPVVLTKGKGVYLWDEQGRRYLDMMSAYSAVSLGHSHPRIVKTLTRQARTLAVTSRAFYNNRLPALLQRLCELTGFDQALPVNTGSEAVETALKAARKWAYKVKGVAFDQAEIIACEGNFHGRSIAIVAMSSEAQYQDGFGPFPPGFKRIAYGDAAALVRAITPNTAAFLVEPMQGEGGIIVPPRGYLAQCAQICRERNVLLICDEVQTGLGRTGKFLACEHEDVKPDGVILGKALGGGLLPVSAFLARRELMQVFTPGDHGSTFGGNPLAAAVALEALNVIVEEKLSERAAELGDYFLAQLRAIESPLIQEVRGLGLFTGIQIDARKATARRVCEKLLARGILSKDTHGTVVRFAPPLTITREQLDWALSQIRLVIQDMGDELQRAA